MGFGRDTSRHDAFIDAYRRSLSHAVQVFGKDKAKTIRLNFSDAREIVEAFSLSSQISASSYFRLQSEFDDDIDPFQELVCYTYGSVRDWSFGVIYSAKLRERSMESRMHSFIFAPLESHKMFLYRRPMPEVQEMVINEFMKWRKSRTYPTAMCMEGDLRKLYLSLTTDGLLRFDVDDFSRHKRA